MIFLVFILLILCFKWIIGIVAPYAVDAMRNNSQIKISKREGREDLYCGLRNPYARRRRMAVAECCLR